MGFLDKIFGKKAQKSPDDELRAVLAKHGDNGNVPRIVDHYVYFKNEEDAGSFRSFVVGRGYQIDESQHEFAVAFSKESAISGPDFDQELSLLRKESFVRDGEYDGWACPVVN